MKNGLKVHTRTFRCGGPDEPVCTLWAPFPQGAGFMPVYPSHRLCLGCSTVSQSEPYTPWKTFLHFLGPLQSWQVGMKNLKYADKAEQNLACPLWGPFWQGAGFIPAHPPPRLCLACSEVSKSGPYVSVKTLGPCEQLPAQFHPQPVKQLTVKVGTTGFRKSLHYRT